MAFLFGRRAVLQMGVAEIMGAMMGPPGMQTKEIEGLRISFKVEKSNQPEPNNAEISVWNLSRDTRSSFLSQGSVPLVLQAGYGDDIAQIFTGDVKPGGITIARDGADWVTTFKAGDGCEAYRTARIQESFQRGTALTAVFERLARSLGKELGPSLARIQAGDVKGALLSFFGGTALSGSVKDELDRVCASTGTEWSIQNDQLQIIAKGGLLPDPVVLLSPDTGLIGSPEPGKDGIIKIRALLQPQLKPLGRVQVAEAQSRNGTYGVFKLTHSGDTHGQDWYTDCEARAVT